MVFYIINARHYVSYCSEQSFSSICAHTFMKTVHDFRTLITKLITLTLLKVLSLHAINKYVIVNTRSCLKC